MKMLQKLAFGVVGLGSLIAAPAMAADTVIKVGLIMTLSGPSASLGENIDRGAQNRQHRRQSKGDDQNDDGNRAPESSAYEPHGGLFPFSLTLKQL